MFAEQLTRPLEMGLDLSIPYTLSETCGWLVHFVSPSQKEHCAGHWAPSQSDTNIVSRDTTKVIFLGDLAPRKCVPAVVASEELRDLLSTADIVLANCEMTVFDIEQKVKRRPLQFNSAPSKLIERLDRLGIRAERLLLSLANNHAYDCGSAGLSRTADALDQLGIRTFGWSDGPRSTHPFSVIENGTEFAIHAWTHWTNRANVELSPHVIIDEPTVRPRRTSNSVSIAYPHWGYEFHHYPQAAQLLQGRSYLDRGFDVVVGHHPHVAQPVEIRNGGICCYSIGNFASPSFAWSTRVFPLLEVWFRRPLDGRRRIAGYRLSFWTEQSSSTETIVVPIEAGPLSLRRQWASLYKRMYGHSNISSDALGQLDGSLGHE